MEKLYNAKISFKGDGNFSFVLPNYGELTIYRGRDIFIKGLTVNGVEALRQLRPLLLEHQLNAKPDGCYKVIDLSTMVKPIRKFERALKEPTITTVADLKASMIKTQGPIPMDETEGITNEDNTNEITSNIDDEVNRIKKELEENEGKKEENTQTKSKEDKRGKAKPKAKSSKKTTKKK